MSDQTTFDAARTWRTYTLTAHVTMHANADLSDPFTRFAVFRALADRLSAAPRQPGSAGRAAARSHRCRRTRTMRPRTDRPGRTDIGTTRVLDH